MLSPQGEEEADSGAGGEFKSAAEMAKEEMGAALEAAADVPPASMVEVTLDGTMEVGEHAIESVEDEIERKVSPSPAQAGRRCSLWRGGVGWSGEPLHRWGETKREAVLCRFAVAPLPVALVSALLFLVRSERRCLPGCRVPSSSPPRPSS